LALTTTSNLAKALISRGKDRGWIHLVLSRLDALSMSARQARSWVPPLASFLGSGCRVRTLGHRKRPQTEVKPQT